MSNQNPLFPGLSFSWKRALGVSGVKNKISRSVGVPTTKSGRQRMMGRFIDKNFEETEPECSSKNTKTKMKEAAGGGGGAGGGAGGIGGAAVNRTGSAVAATGDDRSVIPVDKRKRQKLPMLRRIKIPV